MLSIVVGLGVSTMEPLGSVALLDVLKDEK
jgi:hypothetical protein